MKKFIFYAKGKRSGRKFRFSLDELYGYEGEVEGVFIRGNDIALNYNSGYGFKGMNPDLEIYYVKIINSLN